MQILLTDPLYNLMSLKARNTLRKIDVITLNTYKNSALQTQREPLGIYTFDMIYSNTESHRVAEDHIIGDLIKLEQYENINIESFKNKSVDYMFTLDADIVGLQQHIAEFTPIFRQAFKSYIKGEWAVAFEDLDRCLELWDNDGPTRSLHRFMSVYQFQAPETWNGFRNLDEKINAEEIMRQMGMDAEHDGENAEMSAEGDEDV